MRTAPAPVLAALIAALLAAAAPTRADEIRLVTGRAHQNVTIVDEQYDAVSYEIGGLKQTEKGANVVEVIHTDAPPAYKGAEQLERQGEYMRAATDFEAAARLKQPAWVAQYASFRAAECYRKAGSHDAAVKGYKQLLADHPKTIHYGAAKLGLGMTLAGQKKFDEARKALGELEQEAKAKSLGEQYALCAQLETARSHERQGNASAATPLYKRLALEAKRNHPEIGYQASLGEVRCEGGSRQKEQLTRLIDDEKAPPSVRAGAYVLVGDRQEEAGDHKSALLSYLRVCYDPPLMGFPEERAEALYKAALMLEKVKSKDYAVQAEALRSELKAKYGSSPWAAKLK